MSRFYYNLFLSNQQSLYFNEIVIDNNMRLLYDIYRRKYTGL